MNALYVNDAAKGPGHGFLRITEAPLFASFEGLRFGIKRASDQKNLGPGGWQHAESALAPDAFFLTADGLALAVGPDVADHLDARESYRLTLHAADGAEAVCSLQAPEVAYSPQSGGHGLAEAPPRDAAPEPAPEATPAPPPAAPLPADAAPEPAPLESEAPGILPPLPDAALQRGRSPLRALALLLVVLAAAFALWQTARKDGPAETGEENAARQEEPPASAAQSGPQSGPQSGKPSESKDAPQAPLARARAHLSAPAGADDPAASLALALELGKEAGSEDAVFLLLEDAAQKGGPEAMLLVGGFYDPADKAPSGSIIKDPEEAFAWYAKAKTLGRPEAETRLAALRAWAEAEAAQGSDEARALLRHFK